MEAASAGVPELEGKLEALEKEQRERHASARTVTTSIQEVEAALGDIVTRLQIAFAKAEDRLAALEEARQH
jgi:hypothetical protein